VILFVAAEGREFSGLMRHLRHRRRLDWPLQFACIGELNGRTAVMVADGPGPRLAARAVEVAARQGPADSVVSTGFCGGLNLRLKRDMILIATAIVDSYGSVTAETTIPSYRSPQWQPALEKLLSMNRVAVNAEEKRSLAAFGAGAVEMEAAGVFQRSHEWGTPFYAIRVITDTASDEFSIDFNRMRDSEGRFSRSRIIREACSDPFRLFPELMQFDRRCRRAAMLLGDFLADCQF